MMTLIEKLELGNISSDTDFKKKAVELNNLIISIQKHIQLTEGNKTAVETMSIEDRINYKLFIVYALNSLCWIQLRLRGTDPTTHPVKVQLARIRQVMQKRDELVDRKKRPSLDVDAAKRFIRSGLWDPNNKELLSGPPNKKIKFSEE